MGNGNQSMLDLREAAAYGLIEVTTYLRLPRMTVHYWVTGDEPLVLLTQKSPPRFSFLNLLECHVLSAMRVRGVRLPKIRFSLETAQRLSPRAHPLLENLFQTNGVDLFIENNREQLVNVARGGQLAFKELLCSFLERIDVGENGPSGLFPFVQRKKSTEPKMIRIDPSVCFGRPVIAGTGISTAVLASRFAARESIADLAREYGRTPQEIEEAIRWEGRIAA